MNWNNIALESVAVAEAVITQAKRLNWWKDVRERDALIAEATALLHQAITIQKKKLSAEVAS